MAKKKKTRKQKALSDLRQKAPGSNREISLSQEPIIEKENPRSSMFTFTLQPTKLTPSTTTITKNTSGNEYSFIAHDLKKTALLTTTIVALQLILYFFINRP